MVIALEVRGVVCAKFFFRPRSIAKSGDNALGRIHHSVHYYVHVSACNAITMAITLMFGAKDISTLGDPGILSLWAIVNHTTAISGLDLGQISLNIKTAPWGGLMRTP